LLAATLKRDIETISFTIQGTTPPVKLTFSLYQGEVFGRKM